jgi:putative nucleotidyltransferase-like protein
MVGAGRAAPEGGLEAVAWALVADRTIAKVFAALNAAGVEAIVLKGPSLADLYIGEPMRVYTDSDLLVAEEALPRAASVLHGLGFVRLPSGDVEEEPHSQHAEIWHRSADMAYVDLHRTLPGIGVSPRAAWAILSSRTERLRVRGVDVDVLVRPARALHVALHAAQHGAKGGKPLRDLGLGVERFDEEVWVDALGLARELDALDSLAVGLRLSSDGRDLAAKWGLPYTHSTALRLQAATPPPVARGLHRLLTAESGARGRLLLRELVPSPGFMRASSSLAQRGRTGLLLAYLHRPFWLLKRIGPAWRALRAARRGGAGGPPG